MKISTLLLTLSTISLAACATSPITTQPETPNTQLNNNTSLPYPKPTPQEQIDQLNIKIVTLEQHIEQLNTRIQQLERRSSSIPKRTIRTPQATTPSTTHDNQTQSNHSHLAAAQQAYRKGKYQTVLKLLRKADSGGNGSDIARQSMYLLLQSHLKLGNCQSVINIGQRYATLYANQAKADEALYFVGECQWQIQQHDMAQDTWRQLIRSYPNSQAAQRAANKL